MTIKHIFFIIFSYNFSFVLLYGVGIHWTQITASKPGYLDFDNLPETNFSCEKKVIGGYYADVETGCQMFHVCTIGQKGEVTDIKFLCLNGTVFDQETRVCERIDEVDCSKSEDFFGLNLELYGNNANLGIQPENEFECEDCSTDDDYEESEESTTFATSTTTTTTTTTPKPATTTTTASTTARPAKYQTPSQDTIAALLALHNAFNQGLHNSKVKPAPPRVINNAFSPTTKTTQKPYTAYTTQRPSATFKPHNYNSDSQSFGSLNLQQQERPYYFTPTTERSNYHHFHSGDTSFGHSYDSTRPYNFQYFHARKLPEVQGTISVVTSTSTSTSVRTSKGNTTIEYPTGYEDYQDDIHEVHDPFFADVPKIRQKRTSNISNQTEFQELEKHFDKYYSLEKKLNAREEFLQNLLGSIDMEDKTREKMSSLFRNEETEVEKLENPGGSLTNLQNKLDDNVMPDHNISKTDEIQESINKLAEWKKSFDDMRKDIDLNYTFETNIKDVEEKIRRKRETIGSSDRRVVTGVPPSTRRPQQQRTKATSTEPQRSNSRKAIRQKIDTEKFNFDSNRRSNEGQHELKPVFESIENDYTTVEYRKTSRKGREQPRATTSLKRAFQFNYETTTAISEPERRRPLTPISNFQKPSRGLVHVKQHEPVAALARPTARSVSSFQKASRGSVHEEQHEHVATLARPTLRSLSNLQKELSSLVQEEQTEIVAFTARPKGRQSNFQKTSKSLTHDNHHEDVTDRSVSNLHVPKVLIHEEQLEDVTVTVAPVSNPNLQISRVSAFEQQHGHIAVSDKPVPDHQASRDLIREEHRQHDGVTARQTARPATKRQKTSWGSVYEELPEHAVVPTRTTPVRRSRNRPRTDSTTPSTSTTQATSLSPDPNFSCEGKVKGGFYADMFGDCKGFFICSQGMIDGPLLKTHFWCGATTKFNQRSRTCQAEDLVDCSVSPRYFHLNNDFLVPETEDKLKGSFEPMKVS